jgi:hypothetical protein
MRLNVRLLCFILYKHTQAYIKRLYVSIWFCIYISSSITLKKKKKGSSPILQILVPPVWKSLFNFKFLILKPPKNIFWELFFFFFKYEFVGNSQTTKSLRLLSVVAIFYMS